MKKLDFLDWKAYTSLLSLVVFLLAVFYFIFRNNPPDFGKVLSTQKAGVINLETPKVVSINVPFKVQVIVDSKNQNVNAVGFFLRFNPQHLELTDLDTSESFCQFYPEKKYDNIVGRVTLSCGSPHPGFSGTTTLIELTFRPKLVTNTILTVDPKSKILLSNGSGQNILNEFPVEEISILNSL